MQRIIQINIAGRQMPIEERAYVLLKDYLDTLQQQFASEIGGDEIVQDIEYRIADLFAVRLNSGAPCIDDADVRKVTEMLGAPSVLGGSNVQHNSLMRVEKQQKSNQQTDADNGGTRRIFRDAENQIVGGVCSGLGKYFDVDPVIIRLIWASSILLAGVGLMAYIIAWMAIPAAKSNKDFEQMKSGNSPTFHDITRNVAVEIEDLKKRGEKMSRELIDFFSKKK
jgi:phage shock protein C